MPKKIPVEASLILDYKLFFGSEPPENNISIISDLSKRAVLIEFIGLNYRLKPKEEIFIDVTIGTQLKLLKYFAQTEELYYKYLKIFNKFYKSDSDFPLIFTRQTCLFAIEEIVNSEEISDIEDFKMGRIEVWQAIFKYLLAVNYKITKLREDDEVGFESLNSKLFALNELSIETDPIFTAYRGYQLIDFFNSHAILSKEIQSYINEEYNMTPQEFMFRILEIYLDESTTNPKLNFYKNVIDRRAALFDKLSIRIKNDDTGKLLGIKKSPLIKDSHNKYMIADNAFLIQKTNTQFLNDFWFDWVKKQKDDKGRDKFTIDYYRGQFGYFFQTYLEEIFRKSFENYNHSVLKLFDELKVHSNNGEIEIADIYFRYGKRILLGEVKSRNIYDKEKYGGDLEALYKRDREKFFEDFGINQLVLSLKKLNEHIISIDPKFPLGHAYQVYPCLFVQDKALQTPFFAYIFNKRFQELLTGAGSKKIKINPLSLIHIDDLERAEDFLIRNPGEIWNLLEENVKNKQFIPPFYHTLNHSEAGRNYPERLFELYVSLASRYNPEKEDKI